MSKGGKMKEKKSILVAILVVLLILSVGYIVLERYTTWKQSSQNEIFQQGAQFGYGQAIIQIAQQASTCQQVPLIIENQTLNIIAVGC